MQDDPGLVAMITAKYGSAAMAMIAALMGRLTYHAQEVQAGRRKVFGFVLLLEPVLVIALSILGEGVTSYLGLTPGSAQAAASIGIIAFYGPRGTEKLVRAILKGVGK